MGTSLCFYSTLGGPEGQYISYQGVSHEVPSLSTFSNAQTLEATDLKVHSEHNLSFFISKNAYLIVLIFESPLLH